MKRAPSAKNVGVISGQLLRHIMSRHRFKRNFGVSFCGYAPKSYVVLSQSGKFYWIVVKDSVLRNYNI
ncbi:hypothetical protein, partial [Endozoicomonas sp. ONNA2]|uniref:hypothetical protein n=1 Tax=Endozoicomonas sp. ONNA2 TaxID=2828741 RepID=UPI002148928E